MSGRQIREEEREDTINTTDGKSESNSSHTACQAAEPSRHKDGWVDREVRAGMFMFSNDTHCENDLIPNVGMKEKCEDGYQDKV